MNISKPRPDAAVVLAGLVALALGGLSVLGYGFRIAALVQPFQGLAPMPLAVALCVVAGGSALIVEGSGVSQRWPPIAISRRITLSLASLSIIAGALGITSLAGYLLGVEFLISWPTRTPVSPQAALGFALLGLGLWRALLLRAREQARSHPVDEGRRIHLTAIWVLSLIAVTAGIATFALAQYEYQNVAHGNLERTLRERRAFLEYAIRGHVDHVSLAANPPTLMRFVLSARQPAELGAARQELVAAARDLIDSGFSGWRYELDGHEPIVAGSFVRAPALAVPLIGRYQTELIFSDGYYLRTRIPFRNGDGPIGFAIAEEPFHELARLQLQADSWGDTGTMALCAAEGEGLQCLPLRSNPQPSHLP